MHTSKALTAPQATGEVSVEVGRDVIHPRIEELRSSLRLVRSVDFWERS